MNSDFNGNGHAREDSDNEEPRVVQFPRPDNRPPAREPLINLPPVTKYFIGLLLAIHAVLQFVDPERREWIYEHFGFVSGVYTGHAPFMAAAIAAPFTYALLHGNWGHVLMNGAMLAAFGAGLERLMGGRRMLVLFVLCSLAAIAVQFVLAPTLTDPVIGASGGLSGFFAAVLLMMQQGNDRGRYSLWPLVIMWIAVEAVFGITGAGPGGNNVAWVAHIGGFLAGFVFLKPVLRLRI